MVVVNTRDTVWTYSEPIEVNSNQLLKTLSFPSEGKSTQSSGLGSELVKSPFWNGGNNENNNILSFDNKGIKSIWMFSWEAQRNVGFLSHNETQWSHFYQISKSQWFEQ